MVEYHQSVSIGPQSGDTTPITTQVATGEPLIGHNEDSTYLLAFDHALRPFLDTRIDDTQERQLRLLASTQQDDCMRATTPPLGPTQDIQNTGYESDEEEEVIPEYGIPSYLMEKDASGTRLRQIHLRAFLMHCTILQISASDLERMQWRKDNKRSPRWYYEKMYRLAYKAKSLAEALESKDLQARCEYWAGRGCGGKRDYQAAEAHFSSALNLDVPNDSSPNGKTRFRGLLPAEKANVRFLRDDCSARHKAREKRTTRALKIAERLSEKTSLPLQACLEETLAPSPPWMPDRDRIVQLARQAFDDRDHSGKEAGCVGETQIGKPLGAGAPAGSMRGYKDKQATDRIMLSKKEWYYIKHGDVRTLEQRARQHSAEQYQAAHDNSTPCKASRKRSTDRSRKTSRLASGLTDCSFQSQQYRQSIANELEGLESLDWDRESATASPPELQGSTYGSDQWSPTSPRHLDQDSTKHTEITGAVVDDTLLASASPTGLQQRRHINLDSILTEGLQAQRMLGDAVRSLSSMSKILHPSAQPAEDQATLEKAKRTSSRSPESVQLPSSPPLHQQLKRETTRHISLPAPAPLRSAPLASTKCSSILLAPTTLTRTKSVSSVTSDARASHASPIRSRPVTVSGAVERGHGRTSKLTDSFSAFPWSHSGGIGSCSPTTPDSPHSATFLAV